MGRIDTVPDRLTMLGPIRWSGTGGVMVDMRDSGVGPGHLYPHGAVLRTSPRRITYLSLLAVVVGAAAGGAAWMLVTLIGFLTNLTLFGRLGFDLPSMSELEVSPRIVIVAVLGALIVALLARWSPIIKGHGIPEAMETVLHHQSRVAPRTAVAKPLSAAIAIGTGGPFGAEGPIIVTGGSLGSLLGQVLKVSPSERKILLACGAAAGMAATFGAPIASVVLATELLLFEFSTRAFIPTAVASAVAGGIHSTLFGNGPLFTVPDHGFAGLGDLPLFVPLGLLCGLLAVLISKGLFIVEAGFRRLPVNEFWHPILGALGFGVVALFVPEVLGVGYDQIDAVLAGGLAFGTLATLSGAKLVAWWLALGSGTSGGTLAPVLLISGSFGAMVGVLTLQFFPGSGLSAGAFALVAMAATFGAATRATLTSIVFVFELTRDFDAILPLILASVLADLVGAWLLPNTLMTEKLYRRGYQVHTDLQADVMAATKVRAVMNEPVTTIPVGSSPGDAVAVVEASGHSTFPVVDEEGDLAGMISRSDLLSPGAESASDVGALARSEVVTIGMDSTVAEASRLMISEGVDHLPVLDPSGRMVGMCTRTDVLKAAGPVLSSDQQQAGWLAQRRQRLDER
jgi:chloride channel protein, CIC family